MIHSVSPWTSVVQKNIDSSDKLFGLSTGEFVIEVRSTGDSIWAVVIWPKGGRVAFRVAFGINERFDTIDVQPQDGGCIIEARTRHGVYRTQVFALESERPLFRYTTTFKAAQPLLIPFWPRDIVPLTADGQVENTLGDIHVTQEGGRSGQLFFSFTKPATGSVFYLQNLSAVADVCEHCKIPATDTVGGKWPEMGFSFPVTPENPLPGSRELVISDAFVALSDQIPKKAPEITSMYLECLAAIYVHLPKPAVFHPDWPDIAEKTLEGLDYNKGCWTQTDEKPYLNAYVCDYKTPVEIMVQLAVLLPLREYLEWKGSTHRIYDDLTSGLEAFYNPEIKTVVRWHPAMEGLLDRSEEQKQEMVMDSWYLHHPLLNLSRLALQGDTVAKDLFLKSVDYATKVARHFDYDWPVFYKMTTLEVIKAETAPGEGGEKDVPGSYAHVMLQAYKLTKDEKYLREAKRAAKRLSGMSFDIFYQANNTAFSAGALLELYLETGDEDFLRTSYSCLAAIFRNAQLWECDYGHARNYQTFFAVFPLNDAPYTAAYEELEVFAALRNYLVLARDIEILPALRILIPEFMKYAMSRLAFYYPPLLPPEMLEDEVKTGEISKDLWIPIEDLQDGWTPSGGVGQEVYGAGIPFGIVVRQYLKLEPDLIVSFDYPFVRESKSGRSVVIHLLGADLFDNQLRVMRISKQWSDRFVVSVKRGSRFEPIQPEPASRGRGYKVKGNDRLRLEW